MNAPKPAADQLEAKDAADFLCSIFPEFDWNLGSTPIRQASEAIFDLVFEQNSDDVDEEGSARNRVLLMLSFVLAHYPVEVKAFLDRYAVPVFSAGGRPTVAPEALD